MKKLFIIMFLISINTVLADIELPKDTNWQFEVCKENCENLPTITLATDSCYKNPKGCIEVFINYYLEGYPIMKTYTPNIKDQKEIRLKFVNYSENLQIISGTNRIKVLKKTNEKLIFSPETMKYLKNKYPDLKYTMKRKEPIAVLLPKGTALDIDFKYDSVIDDKFRIYHYYLNDENKLTQSQIETMLYYMDGYLEWGDSVVEDFYTSNSEKEFFVNIYIASDEIKIAQLGHNYLFGIAETRMYCTNGKVIREIYFRDESGVGWITDKCDLALLKDGKIDVKFPFFTTCPLLHELKHAVDGGIGCKTYCYFNYGKNGSMTNTHFITGAISYIEWCYEGVRWCVPDREIPNCRDKI